MDNKKLKKRVGARMDKTGERYAVARQHVVAKIDAERQAFTQAAVDKATASTAAGAVSDDRCKTATGHGFDHWFTVLTSAPATSVT